MIGQKLWAGMVLASVFALGAAVGVFFDRHHSISASASLSPAEFHDAAMTEMRETLDLDEEQLERIHTIISDRQELVQRIWEQMRPAVSEAMREVHREIAAVLRPDQLERYHRWLSDQRHHVEGEGVVIIPH